MSGYSHYNYNWTANTLEFEWFTALRWPAGTEEDTISHISTNVSLYGSKNGGRHQQMFVFLHQIRNYCTVVIYKLQTNYLETEGQ